VKPTIVGLVLLLVAFGAVQAQPPKADLNFQQSPLKPEPDWVKIVDYGQFDARLKGYFVPEGIKVEIVAEEPTVINPVGMTFDNDGNLYVLEWVEAKGLDNPKKYVELTYKDGSKRKVLIAHKPIKDRVKLLGYNAKKGVYDSAKVVLEDDLPSSILVHDGWMYLSGQGTVRRYQQQKDGSWGKKEVIAQGFCGWHHHQVSGLTIGNDGWLYITSGDNDNYVEGSDGSRATVLRTGAIFRCRPDGSKMHVYSIGYRNPYRDVVFDDKFNMFHADNDNEDGSKWTGCRLMHIPLGVDFGWRLRPGTECCVPDFTRSAVYGELPGKLPPMHKTGRGSPAGLLLYNDVYFPEQYRGMLYYPDVFRRVVRAYQVAPIGATFDVTNEFEMMRANDPLFRPCQMVLGPDGAMYVCDWRTDSGGAGKLWGDTKHGRIYRLSWKGTKQEPAIALRGLDAWAKIAKQSDEDLFKTLDSDNFSDRLRAQQEIVRRGDKQRQALVDFLKDEDNKSVNARIAALGALQSLKTFEPAPFIERLKDFSPDIRRLAADALALHCPKGDNDAHEALVAAANDDDFAVRRAIYLAIGQINNAGAPDVIVNGIQFDRRLDDYYTDGLLRALEYTGKNGIAKLLTLADSGSDRDLERVLEIYPMLRTREAAEKLPALLKNYHVKPEQTIALIRTYLYIQVDPPISVEPLVKFLDELPAEPTKKITEGQLNSMRLAALDVLAISGKVNSDKLKGTLVTMLKTDDPKSRATLLRTIGDAKLASAVPVLLDQLAAAQDDAGRLALIRTLGQVGERAAFKPVLGHLKSTDPAVRIEVLRALAGIDNREAHKIARDRVAAEHFDVQRETIVLLGQNVDGARAVGKLFADKKLPRSLLPEVTESLRRFASKEHPDITNLLTRVVKDNLLVSLDPAELKRVTTMVRDKGDPVRGRALYLNNKAVACMTCHRLEGVGGNVGPDLTRVWDTLSLEKVMESMLDPSKEIKEGYVTYVATTKNGLTVTGLKVSQNDKELILRDATGKEVRIAAADLDEVNPSKKSLMPDDVVRHLSLNEFIDLVSFLRDKKSQEELRGLVLTAWAVGPLDFDLKKSNPLEKNPDPDTAVIEGKNRLHWRQVQADITGKGFDLRPVIGREPASGYLLTYVFAPKDQSVRLHLQCDEKLQLWLNAKSVEPKVEATPLDLKQGWNVLLLRLNNAEASPFLSARIVGGEGLRVGLQKD
jgi:putative membrane-bound dehydrogenase-like protein